MYFFVTFYILKHNTLTIFFVYYNVESLEKQAKITIFQFLSFVLFLTYS